MGWHGYSASSGVYSLDLVNGAGYSIFATGCGPSHRQMPCPRALQSIKRRGMIKPPPSARLPKKIPKWPFAFHDCFELNIILHTKSDLLRCIMVGTYSQIMIFSPFRWGFHETHSLLHPIFFRAGL